MVWLIVGGILSLLGLLTVLSSSWILYREKQKAISAAKSKCKSYFYNWNSANPASVNRRKLRQYLHRHYNWGDKFDEKESGEEKD